MSWASATEQPGFVFGVVVFAGSYRVLDTV